MIYCIEGLNFDNHRNYKELINEVINKVVKIKDVFRQYV